MSELPNAHFCSISGQSTNSGGEELGVRRGSKRPALTAALRELRGKDLACWYAPLPCHGDVLLDLANRGELQRPFVSGS
jgi:hypothetical protein